MPLLAAIGLLPAMERGNAQGSGSFSRGLAYSPGAQHDSVVLPGRFQVVYPQDAPFEAGLQLGQGLRLDGLKGLDRT